MSADLPHYSTEFSLTDVGCAPLEGQCCAGQATILISAVALLIISSIALSGGMSLSTTYGLAIGFGATLLLANLGAGNLSRRKCMVLLGTLTAAGIIAVGAMGFAGLGPLTTLKAVGISLLALSLPNALYLGVCCDAGIARCQQKRPTPLL